MCRCQLLLSFILNRSKKYFVKYCFGLYSSIQISLTALHIWHAFFCESDIFTVSITVFCVPHKRMTHAEKYLWGKDKASLLSLLPLPFFSLSLSLSLSLSFSLSTNTKRFHYWAHWGISWHRRERLVLRLINLRGTNRSPCVAISCRTPGNVSPNLPKSAQSADQSLVR